MIRLFYTDQEAVVRTQYGDTEWFKIERGVGQGCILSWRVMRKLCLEESEIDVKIGGRNINNLRYSEDTTLLAVTENGLKHLIIQI